MEESDDSGLVAFLDEIPVETICHLEIDGTQTIDWDSIMAEEDLMPPLHVRRTLEGLQVGSEVAMYPSVPKDWYHGPSDPIHIRNSKWKEIDVSLPHEEPKLIKVGSQLEGEELEAYRFLIMEYRDVFAWSYLDLQGIPPEIIQLTISVLLGVISIRQRQRRMNPTLQLIVKAEIERLLQARFIMPVEITDWVSPMVLVKKKNGKLCVCVDYRQSNKHTCKDHFPLPFINTIVDEVAGNELFTFMDRYSSYNQISIALEDWSKTAFITPWSQNSSWR